MVSRENRLARACFAAVFWIVLWQGVSLLVGKELLVPSPWRTLAAFFEMASAADFYVSVGATVLRVLLGIVLSTMAGMLAACLAFYLPLFREVLHPAVAALKSVPVMAVILYAIFLFTSGNVPVFVCFMMCFPIVYTNLLDGFFSVDRQYVEMAEAYGLREGAQLLYLYLPGAGERLRSALSLCTGFAWKSVVAAEVLASPRFSMGYPLMNAKSYMETEKLFAWTIAIIACSIVFEKLFDRALSGLRIFGLSGGNPAVRKEGGPVK